MRAQTQPLAKEFPPRDDAVDAQGAAEEPTKKNNNVPEEDMPNGAQ